MTPTNLAHKLNPIPVMIPKGTQTIVCDIGNVLITYNEEGVARKIHPYCKNKDIHQIISQVFRSAAYDLFMVGAISKGKYYQLVRRYLSLKSLSEDAFFDLYRTVYRSPNKDLRHLLQTSQESGMKVVLLTNIDVVLLSHLLTKYRWLRKYSIVASCEHGSLKPSKEMFDYVEAINGTPLNKRDNSAKNILYMDDLRQNILAAKLRGWDVVQYP